MNSIPERSADTTFIYNRLLASAPGEFISYQELESLIGRSVRPGQHGYSNLSSARRIAEIENRIIFGTIAKNGIKRLTDSEIIKTSSGQISKIRRVSRKGAHRLTSVNYNTLSQEDKIKHNVNLTMINLSAELTTPGASKRITAMVTETKTHLPMMKALELFK